MGAQDAALVNGRQWWRLFTSPWVNAGVIQVCRVGGRVVYFRLPGWVLEPTASCGCMLLLPPHASLTLLPCATPQLLLNMSCLWTFGRYLEGALPRFPGLSMAAIFLLGSWTGALASANLNCCYVSCGASAGVCALLGRPRMLAMLN